MGPAAVMVSVGLRMAARRPAAWLAFAAAVACGALLAAVGGAAAWPVAIVCGGLVSIAAVGDQPRGRPGVALPAVVWWSPLAWPLAGAAVVAGVEGSSGRMVAIAIVAAAVGAAMFRLALGRIALCWRMATDQTLAEQSPRGIAAVPGWLGPDGPRSLLVRVALGTTLLAMPVCFFLDPDRAGWYVVVAVAWFVALALPVVAGVGDDAARDRLVRSAAGPTSGNHGAPLPGTLAHAVRVLVAHAALLAWPAVVAALLWGGRADRGDGPLAAIAVLTAVTAGTAGVLAVACLCGASGDTARATVACAMAVTVAALPQSPFQPSPRSPLGLEAAIRAEVGVEGLRPSCKTPQATQTPWSSRLLVIVTGVPIDGVEKSRATARY